MTSPPSKRDGTALAAFIVGTVLAGGNAVGVRVSNRELDPLWCRTALPARRFLLGAVMAVMRLTFPVRGGSSPEGWSERRGA